MKDLRTVISAICFLFGSLFVFAAVVVLREVQLDTLERLVRFGFACFLLVGIPYILAFLFLPKDIKVEIKDFVLTIPKNTTRFFTSKDGIVFSGLTIATIAILFGGFYWFNYSKGTTIVKVDCSGNILEFTNFTSFALDYYYQRNGIYYNGVNISGYRADDSKISNVRPILPELTKDLTYVNFDNIEKVGSYNHTSYYVDIAIDPDKYQTSFYNGLKDCYQNNLTKIETSLKNFRDPFFNEENNIFGISSIIYSKPLKPVMYTCDYNIHLSIDAGGFWQIDVDEVIAKYPGKLYEFPFYDTISFKNNSRGDFEISKDDINKDFLRTCKNNRGESIDTVYNYIIE